MASPDVTISGRRREEAQPASTDLQALAGPRNGRRTGANLKSRALRLLSRREYTRAELRRKLLMAEGSAARQASQRGEGSNPAESASPAPEAITQDLLERLDSLLDELEGNRLLSDRRYAEVLVSSKGARYGVARLSRTLATQGVGGQVAEAALAPLRASQRERALAIWKRRFGQPPSDLRERARQHRFLIGRGFDPATVSWVLKQGGRSAE